MAGVQDGGNHGCVLILRDREGRFFALRELLDNPKSGKRAGHLSLPFETQLPGESEHETLERMLFEEVDATRTLRLEKLADLCRLGDIPVGEVEAHVFSASLPVEFAKMRFSGKYAGSEYEPLGFVPEHALAEGSRPGVLEALSLLMGASVRENLQKKPFVL